MGGKIKRSNTMPLVAITGVFTFILLGLTAASSQKVVLLAKEPAHPGAEFQIVRLWTSTVIFANLACAFMASLFFVAAFRFLRFPSSSRNLLYFTPSAASSSYSSSSSSSAAAAYNQSGGRTRNLAYSSAASSPTMYQYLTCMTFGTLAVASLVISCVLMIAELAAKKSTVLWWFELFMIIFAIPIVIVRMFTALFPISQSLNLSPRHSILFYILIFLFLDKLARLIRTLLEEEKRRLRQQFFAIRIVGCRGRRREEEEAFVLYIRRIKWTPPGRLHYFQRLIAPRACYITSKAGRERESRESRLDPLYIKTK